MSRLAPHSPFRKRLAEHVFHVFVHVDPWLAALFASIIGGAP